MIKTDCLIIGGGLAGLYTALQVKDKNVTIISKDTLENTNTYLAQGGIAAEMTHDVSLLKKHIIDTLKAGSWHNDIKATEKLVYDANNSILKLINLGVEFDKDSEGNISLTLEGGHSKNRILHAGGDATGKVIMEALIKKVLDKENITFIPNTIAVDLLTKKGECYGATCIDENNNIFNIYADSTIIATGGLGGVYKHSTNPSFATGDGIALAHRAKATIRDLEFIQFHPTSFLSSKDSDRSFLISEAVRGEGAFLVNASGERFMKKYNQQLELAPRDIVSQSIVKEMYDTWNDCVYLDARHLGIDKLKRRFPTIYAECKKHGYEMDKELIPIIPVQHYSVGGIKTNVNGQTSIKNLFANGECASTRVHGANRLASNSLLECIVFGDSIANEISNMTDVNMVEFDLPYSEVDLSINYKPVIDEIKSIMDKYVGVIKTREGLEIAKKIVSKHYKNLLNNINQTKNYYQALNVTTTATLIIEAAQKRKKSIGCHYVI